MNNAVKFFRVDRCTRNVERIIQHVRISRMKFTEHLPDLVVSQVCVGSLDNYYELDASLKDKDRCCEYSRNRIMYSIYSCISFLKLSHLDVLYLV